MQVYMYVRLYVQIGNECASPVRVHVCVCVCVCVCVLRICLFVWVCQRECVFTMTSSVSPPFRNNFVLATSLSQLVLTSAMCKGICSIFYSFYYTNTSYVRSII
jgi:formate hydrogenlyase subunit 3/multisubunit Na+/H+ antiporter MnhD subunit